MSLSVPAITVSLELNQIEAGEFVVGSSLVGGSDVIGDGLSQIESAGVRCSIRRGRWEQLFDDFEAASVSVVLNNEDRQFDPSHATGDYFGELLPGRDIEITAAGLPIFTGFVQDYDLEYDVSGRSVTIARATDALGRFGALEFDAWTNTGRDAVTKLTNICNRSEVQWASSLRDFIGAEINYLPGFAVPVPLISDSVSWGSNVLNYMQLIAKSDWLSFLFTSATGVLTLRSVGQFAGLNFFAWAPGPSVASFGGSGTFEAVLYDDNGEPLLDGSGEPLTGTLDAIPFQAITAQYGSERLYSEVSVDTDAIDAQTASVADVPAWQATYGPSRRLSLPGLLIGDSVPIPALTAEVVAGDLADDLLAFYEAPAFRITEISVELAALSTAQQQAVLDVDITDVVDISFTPNGVGAAIEQTLVVQGIAHEITPESHVMTFSVIDYTV